LAVNAAAPVVQSTFRALPVIRGYAVLTDTELIRRLEFFEPLEQKIIKDIAGVCIVREFAAGEAIVRQGEAGLGLYFITGGRARVEIDRGGHKAVVAELKEGDFLGEFAIIDDQTRSASVICLEDTRCLLLTRDSFAKLLKKYPEIAGQMLRTLVGRIRSTNVRITQQTAQQAGQQAGQPAGALPQVASQPAAPPHAGPAQRDGATAAAVSNGTGIGPMTEQIAALLPAPEDLVQYYSSSKGRTQQFFNRFLGTIYAMKAMLRFSMAIVGCPVTVRAEGSGPEVLQGELNGVHVVLFPAEMDQALCIEAYADGDVSAALFRPAEGASLPPGTIERLAMPIREGDILRWRLPATGPASLEHSEPLTR
jgi:CRP/FNR family transcriptional regulator